MAERPDVEATLRALDLPPPIVDGTTGFVRHMRSLLGTTLQSVVLYGPAIRGGYVPFASDLNLMLVTEELGIEHLRRIAETVRDARRAFKVAPLFITHEDLERSTDVFPLLFLDMQERHVLLLGTDLLPRLEISREHLRLACEQDARNMVLRLRQLYLFRGTLRTAILEVLGEMLVPFVRLLHNVLDISGQIVPDDREHVLAAAAEYLGLDGDSLTRLWQIRREDVVVDRETVERLYESFMNDVVKVATFVDRMEIVPADG